MIYIAFLQHPEKKKIDLPTLPVFQAKRENKPLVFLGLTLTTICSDFGMIERMIMSTKTSYCSCSAINLCFMKWNTTEKTEEEYY